MSEPAKTKALYEDLFAVPENMTGEIIDGEVIATPRPSRRHTLVTGLLGGEIIPPYFHGWGGGPGGWIIIIESEVGLGEDILVPDLAGWKKERFPVSEETNWISVVPEWVCEVLSPRAIRVDKIKKMHICAHHGVRHCWLIDPIARTLDVLRLETDKWVLAGVYAEDDKVRAEPFQEAEIALTRACGSIRTA